MNLDFVVVTNQTANIADGRKAASTFQVWISSADQSSDAAL